MSELKKVGTAQNVKTYRRHGARGDLFGVSFAELGRLKKKIKVDHGLAVELWKSGNVDARTLATMIADPAKITAAQADSWVTEVDYYLIGDVFAGLMAKTGHAAARIGKWTKSKKEFVRQCGYNTLASALKEGVEISDVDCKSYLKAIEEEIHGSANRARYAMNNAVIAIGVFRPALSEAAIATARKIGRVEVDHGETSCTTPDAAAYIEKSLSRKK
jgi:3-methyladenine DNA glycosylase AlkD